MRDVPQSLLPFAFAVPIDDHHVLVALTQKRLAVVDLSSNAMRIIGENTGISVSRDARILLSADRHREEDIWLLTLGGDQAHSRQHASADAKMMVSLPSHLAALIFRSARSNQ